MEVQHCFTNIHSSGTSDIILTNNDKYMITTSEDLSICLYDFRKRRCFKRVEIAHPRFIFVTIKTTDDKYIITGSADSTIKVWYLPTLTCVKTITNAHIMVYFMAITSDNKYLISCGADSYINIYDFKRFSLLHRSQEDQGSSRIQLW